MTTPETPPALVPTDAPPTDAAGAPPGAESAMPATDPAPTPAGPNASAEDGDGPPTADGDERRAASDESTGAVADAPPDAGHPGESHATAPRAPALGDAVLFTPPDLGDGTAPVVRRLHIVTIFQRGMADLAETPDGPPVVHARLVGDGTARLRAPADDAEDDAAAIAATAPIAGPTERIRQRIAAMMDGTATYGAPVATATDAHLRAVHNFLNAMPSEAAFRTWSEGLREEQRTHMLALLHDPRAQALFNPASIPSAEAPPAPAAAPVPGAAPAGAASHGPPPAAVDETNRRIAERFRGVAGGVAPIAAPANAPNAPPVPTQPVQRMAMIRSTMPVPTPMQPPAAAPDKCARGCRLNHIHHFA